MIAPTIHLNGTPSERLLDGYTAARDAITAALSAVRETAPHMRDYYVQPGGEGLWNKAVEEHRDRLSRLEVISGEFVTLAEAVLAQGVSRGTSQPFDASSGVSVAYLEKETEVAHDEDHGEEGADYNVSASRDEQNIEAWRMKR